MEYKNLWDLESAMQVLESDTVDSQLWAEAVEWLILYGPPEIRKLLLNASLSATEGSFPQLKPSGFAPDGQPIYDIEALAKVLGISENEVRVILEKKNAEHQSFEKIDTEGSSTIN